MQNTVAKIFKLVPELPWLEVSEDGEVHNLLTGEKSYGECKDPQSNKYYLNAFSYQIHRLVALAWLPRPDVMTGTMWVNHRDGIKKHNHVNNLEWCTPSENAIHAYQNGLREDNTPILVKDLRDDSVVEFYSLQACARHFQKNGALIHHYLKNSSKIRFGYFVLIRKGQEWPSLTKDDLNKSQNSALKVLRAFNLETEQTWLFESVSQAAAFIGVKPDTLRMHLKRYGEKPYFGLSFKEVTDYALKEEIIKRRQAQVAKPTAKRQPLPVSVINMDTGQETKWDSLEAFASSVGTSKNTVQCGLVRSGGYWNKFKISYIVPSSSNAGDESRELLENPESPINHCEAKVKATV